MASAASQLVEEVTAHAQSDNLEDGREICADGTSLPNNLRINEIYLGKLQLLCIQTHLAGRIVLRAPIIGV